MNEKVGEVIKRRRIELGMTQKELASSLYVTDKAVSKWERGICYPDVELLQSIADALKISIEELTAARYPIFDSRKKTKMMFRKAVMLLVLYIAIVVFGYIFFFSDPRVLFNVKRSIIYAAIIAFNVLFVFLFRLLMKREME
ncbi:Helix-turn-helix domain-containing protein [Butyrivibrio sp. INlla18]|uniref:helix-turn-helix transcriptional regulator n=1 Tax=Butyrivibrio sp. INlla18 TaxID=1520806 RepID=UPI0008897049|nr:helix-turn-helix transcriptional regulator [Butyrivibrio sp. INlla18]SDA71884.1 Helix-turn-helix domain-containing protein [Butyrivibrio sp. INlla18]